MNCRAIAFDLDDTLLRDDLSVSDFTVDTLREVARRGVRVIPCSGRARDSMLPIVRRIGCADCFVACNGSEVWSAGGELLHRSLLTTDTTRDIAAFGRRHGVYMQTYQGAHFYFTEEGYWADAYARSSMPTGFFTPDLEGFLAAHDICKILMMGEVEHIAAMLREGQPLFAGRASVTCSKPYFLEFNPPDSNKAHGLEVAGSLFVTLSLGFQCRAARMAFLLILGIERLRSLVLWRVGRYQADVCTYSRIELITR